MLFERVEKIKSLVKISPLLTEGERMEWLQLSGLMNDKQLLELEKILSVGRPEQARAADADLRLSHILNLPAGQQPSASEPQDKIARPAPAVQNSARKSASPFEQLASLSAPKISGGQRQSDTRFKNSLSAALSEKELSAPKPEFALQAPKPPASAAAQPRQPARAPALLPSRPAAMAPDIKPVQPAPVPPPQPEPLPKPADQQAAPAGPPLQLNSIADLSGLSLNDFLSADQNFLVKKIRLLAASHGLYEILFALERSSLYQAYLDTGIRLLKDGLAFEQLGQQDEPLGKRYLSRFEFERVVDLLRQVQAG